jgi:hypothetical protein
MCSISVFVIVLKSSPARCGVLPLPEPAKLISFGRAFASAISSLTVFAGTDGCTTSTFGAMRPG